jgi:glycosyltransferase involved in cell wall biosynthesis
MNLLFIVENYLPHYGGVEVVFKNLSEGLAARGHAVTVLTRLIPGTAEEETVGRVRVVRVRCADSRYVFTFSAIPRALALARDADLVHTTTFNAAPVAWFAANARRKPVVLTVHETWMGKWRVNSDFPLWKALLHELLERAVFAFAYTKYICVSDATARSLVATLPQRRDRVLTIHNGFDASPWKMPRTETALKKRMEMGLRSRFVIFAWGRPGTSKGFWTLVNAFPLVKQAIPDACLILGLSGGKQYAHVVDAMKRAVGADVVIVRSPAHDEIQTFAHMADCLVVPSVSEGFGYTVLESVSTGTPLVATNTTSIPEVISGKHVLVEPKSAVALAEGIIAVRNGRYLTTPEKAFPWSANIDAHERLYEALLDRA